jgi:tyrosine-specific transport protein
MDTRRGLIWRGARPVIGSVVGVGIFGLPYVFAQAGYWLGAFELFIIGSLCLVTLLVFADLLAISPGHTRFVAVIGNQLGLPGRAIATLAFFGSLWGAMLAYIIVGGQFVFNLFEGILGGAVTTYQLLFWLTASALMIGGSLFVKKLQSFTIPTFFILIAALTLFTISRLDVDRLTSIDISHALLPFGVLLFAFSGFAAVAEGRESLGRYKNTLIRPALVLAVCLIGSLYLLFTFAIVGMTGAATSVEAVLGLSTVGKWLVVFVSLIGFFSVFTAYISQGLVVMNSFLYDFKIRFLTAWALTISIPIGLFLLGARNFVHVIGTTGGVLGALSGVLLLIAYERARLSASLPKRSLRIPQALILACFLVFVCMMVITLWPGEFQGV